MKMELTKEYLAEQEDTIKRNFEGYKKNIKDPITMDRLQTLKAFCAGANTILSVGSGGFEPVFIGASHAVDVSSASLTFLLQQGWRGSFFSSSCDALPFPDSFFDVAVCSEVIEHLPDLEAVRKTFLELDRVAQRWIATTPNKDVHEPTHKRIFTIEQLYELTKDLNVTIEIKGIFYYIYKHER